MIDCLPLAASSHLPADVFVLNSLHPQDHELTNEKSLSCCRTSLPIYNLQIDYLQGLLQSRSIMASKWISKLSLSRPPSASLSSTWSRPPSASLSYSILACICISKLSRSWPPGASLCYTISASKCISKLGWSQPLSASLNPLDYGLHVTPLVLQVYFWDHTGSLNNPNMDRRSGITNCHSYFCNGSTIQISPPISDISIAQPSHELIDDRDLANCKWHVYHICIVNGRGISIVNGHSLSAGNLIPSCWTNHYPLMLQ